MVKKASPETVAVSRAIQQSIRRAESAAVVENTVRWCSNILVEVNSIHGPNLPKEAHEALRELATAIQRASASIRKH